MRLCRSFHERLLLVLSPDVDAVLPSPGNPPSPYMAELSGRLVLDIWSPDFKQIEQGLVELGDYGITDCVGIIHVWQHAGYDNALPQHYPANEAMGGDAGLTAAVNAGKADGCLMALHENYVDYYPNYPRVRSIRHCFDERWKADAFVAEPLHRSPVLFGQAGLDDQERVERNRR